MPRTIRYCLTLLLILGGGNAFAQSLIVDTDAVEQAQSRGAVIWDARNAKDYAEGHIPGAVSLGGVGDVFRDPIREDPPSAAEASELFGDAGMDILNREIIVYGGKGDPYAYFAARMVEYYGGPHARVYHGGIDDWKAASKPVSTKASKLPPVSLKLGAERVGTTWTGEMIDLVRRGGAQILDVRTPNEFTGQDVRAIRGGHIPGATHIPFENNWIDPDTPSKLAAHEVKSKDGLALKPRDELKALYASLDPDKETVVYCQSGVRASETAAILRDLGFRDVKVYEPSWLGYAGVLSAPAEDEVFFNVGAMLGQIAGLKKQIQTLESQLDKLRAAQAKP